MIEVDDARLSYYLSCIARERMAAHTSKTDEAKMIHVRLMQKYERKVEALRR